MPDGVEVKINVAEFTKQMRELGSKIQKRIARRAVNAGAKVLVEIARQRAPVLKAATKNRVPGALKKNIITLRSRFQPPNAVLYNVGVRTLKTLRTKSNVKRLGFKRAGDPFYWYILEHGWVPRGPGNKLRGGERSRQLQRRRLIAGGAKVKQFPYFAPAFSSGKERALQAILVEFEKSLKVEAARVG
jgi:HK97 gp10 family phage protein